MCSLLSFCSSLLVKTSTLGIHCTQTNYSQDDIDTCTNFLQRQVIIVNHITHVRTTLTLSQGLNP